MGRYKKQREISPEYALLLTSSTYFVLDSVAVKCFKRRKGLGKLIQDENTTFFDHELLQDFSDSIDVFSVLELIGKDLRDDEDLLSGVSIVYVNVAVKECALEGLIRVTKKECGLYEQNQLKMIPFSIKYDSKLYSGYQLVEQHVVK
jgi:hypothetical protein